MAKVAKVPKGRVINLVTDLQAIAAFNLVWVSEAASEAHLAHKAHLIALPIPGKNKWEENNKIERINRVNVQREGKKCALCAMCAWLAFR